MSQKKAVLLALHDAGERGVCVSDLPTALNYTARNRVAELRKAGVAIDSEPCRVHRHRSTVARYRLAARGQLALLP